MADTLNDTAEYLTSQLETAKEEDEVLRRDISSQRQDLNALENRKRKSEAMISALETALENLKKASKA